MGSHDPDFVSTTCSSSLFAGRGARACVCEKKKKKKTLSHRQTSPMAKTMERLMSCTFDNVEPSRVSPPEEPGGDERLESPCDSNWWGANS